MICNLKLIMLALIMTSTMKMKNNLMKQLLNRMRKIMILTDLLKRKKKVKQQIHQG